MSPASEPHQVLASPRRLTAVVAAILIVLHWAAPSLRPLHLLAAFGSPDTLSSYDIGLQRGIPPQIAKGTQASNVDLRKSGRNSWAAHDAAKALPPVTLPAAPQIRTGSTAHASPARLVPRAIRAFEARGPPVAA
jgi:hypothetical protein